MKLIATLTALSLAATTFAQSASSPTVAPASFNDPANLRGERVAPRDGRELPIDGGQGNNALGLQQMLRRLSTRASILNIVAHPDDEDGGMLTFYARGMGARVADLSLTRGEGGQNAMTGDFEDALGLLRTQELLANDRYTGVTQMFGTEVDFGFSKTKSEAFAKWTHERVLYDAVRAIRLYRPLVITSTWTGGVTDGHGQHQVSGEIAQEAFVAAGDPNVFPELTAEGIYPWQPLKVFARVPQQAISEKGLYDYATGQYVPAKFTNYVTGVTATTTPTTDVTVHEGASDPLFTKEAANAADIEPDASRDPDTPFSYVQFARIGLGLQKSQIGPGFRMPKSGATFDVPYHQYGSKVQAPSKAADRASFFDGIDTSIAAIAQLDDKDFPTDLLSYVARGISAANEHFDPAHPSAIAPVLAAALESMNQLITAVGKSHNGTPQQHASAMHELLVKRVQLNDALALSIGLSLTARVDAASLQVNHATEAQIHLTESSRENVLFSGSMSENSKGRGIAEAAESEDVERPLLAYNHPVDTSCGFDASQASNLTRPYFSRDSVETPVYKLSNEALREAPGAPPAITCDALVTYKQTLLELAAVATHNTQPAAFIPPATIAFSNHAQVLPAKQTSMIVSLQVSPSGARVETKLPKDWTVHPDKEPKRSPEGFKQLDLDIPLESREASTVQAIAVLPDKAEVTEGYRTIGYGDLPRTNYYRPATIRIIPVDLKLPARRRIAYLPGTGDAIPEALASVGLPPTILKVDELTAALLAKFDTVILGVRTYNAHPDLHGKATQALLDFARSGGNVLVQYQTGEFTAADAPYPLSLGTNERVVDETSPVELLTEGSQSDHAERDHSAYSLLTTPNVITPADFNGWIEERGHGFLTDWDPRYAALTETHDPGAPSEDVAPQAPQRGGLITARIGKGRWTYCAFALYRQLPEAVPGAWRLFVNLIDLPPAR
jgi:LmbE family N-acetylglucosaminyl deacetylase